MHSKYKIPPLFYQSIFVLGLIVVFILGTSPILEYTDKMNYNYNFENLTFLNIWSAKDIGFALYSYAIKMLVDDSGVYFIVTSFIYVFGYFIFARRFFNKSMVFYFLLGCFCSFGFTAYGVNTIRAGLALSLLLIGLSFYKKTKLFLIYSLMAVLCHKSMALPLFAFYITRFNNNLKLYLYFWVFCLAIATLNIVFISNFVQGIIGGSDEGLGSYFAEKNLARYNTGFRTDFVIYSVIPILVGRYYIIKLKVKDVFYNRMLNAYIFSNAIWLLVIRMAFTDRIAYLSWFLIPFILLYPQLKYPLHINKQKWVFIILLGIFSFTSLMYFK
jgi:hypothetical protein